jgi:hypothetical protein
MKIKDFPDVDGFYWYRLNTNSSYRIVKVNGCAFQFIADSYSYTVRSAQWIGPLMPDGIEIYISK